jgi:branched-chain amino acid aminotransferase
MDFLLNGRFVPESQARVPVSDRGFLYGDAAFDTLCAYGGRLFRAREHLDRLQRSLAQVRIEPPAAVAQMQSDLYCVLERNALRDAILRITVSRGSGARGPSIRGAGKPTYLIACHAPVLPGAEHVHLEIVSLRRTPGASVPASAKTANYLNSILALAQAQDAGADEALLLDTQGRIAECAYSNVFFVRAGQLFTPAIETGILPGITRAAVLELARGRGVRVHETDIDTAWLAGAEEAFITNSVRGVVPVLKIGAQEFAVPGPLTATLAQRYWALVAQEAGPRWM